MADDANEKGGDVDGDACLDDPPLQLDLDPHCTEGVVRLFEHAGVRHHVLGQILRCLAK